MSREVRQLPCGIEVYPAHTWMDWMYLQYCPNKNVKLFRKTLIFNIL